jgi:hypothetical protein
MVGTLLQIARCYRAAGLSVVPVLADGSKRPALDSWDPFKERLATDAEMELWFGSGEVVGVGIVCGKVSGGLEVFDFDSRDAWEKWKQLSAVRARLAAWESMPRVRTPSGGVHVYVRRSGPAGNRKLAKDPAGKTLVEVKGEGGYVVAPGSPPECHPSGGVYTWEVPWPGVEA